jgi:outer membrane protein TolC
MPSPTPPNEITSPQPTASPQSTPSAIPARPLASPQSPSTGPSANVLTLDDALRLANLQASAFQQAGFNEQIAVEDLRQAKAAFLPRVSAPLGYLYTTPALGLPAGEPRAPSFIANNAIGEYQAYVEVSGDFDIAGRLRATLARNRALLAAAHAGTDVARRALIRAVTETYYSLALANAEQRAAEQNLTAAEEFEHITSLLLSGGEVASVDLTRAQLQTTARRDELERARANEEIAAGSLRVLVGYDFAKPISTSDLALAVPMNLDLQRFKLRDVSRRPEFLQFDSQLKAAQQDVRIARADRLPWLSYSVLGGFDADSLKGPRLKEHSGVSGLISLNIPIFDWGSTKSKERQARLRVQLAESERAVALRGFTQEFYAAQALAASAAVRVRLATSGITQAESNLSASIARYRAGEAQIVEVTDAQTTLVTQRSGFYQALFDYQIALGRLRQATGQ